MRCCSAGGTWLPRAGSSPVAQDCMIDISPETIVTIYDAVHEYGSWGSLRATVPPGLCG